MAQRAAEAARQRATDPTETLLAQLLTRRALALQERSQAEGVTAFLRRPVVRGRLNERFLQNTLRDVRTANRRTEEAEMWELREAQLEREAREAADAPWRRAGETDGGGSGRHRTRSASLCRSRSRSRSRSGSRSRSRSRSRTRSASRRGQASRSRSPTRSPKRHRSERPSRVHDYDGRAAAGSGPTSSMPAADDSSGKQGPSARSRSPHRTVRLRSRSRSRSPTDLRYASPRRRRDSPRRCSEERDRASLRDRRGPGRAAEATESNYAAVGSPGGRASSLNSSSRSDRSPTVSDSGSSSSESQGSEADRRTVGEAYTSDRSRGREGEDACDMAAGSPAEGDVDRRQGATGEQSEEGNDDDNNGGGPYMMTDEEIAAMLSRHRVRGRGGVGSKADAVGPEPEGGDGDGGAGAGLRAPRGPDAPTWLRAAAATQQVLAGLGLSVLAGPGGLALQAMQRSLSGLGAVQGPLGLLAGGACRGESDRRKSKSSKWGKESKSGKKSRRKDKTEKRDKRKEKKRSSKDKREKRDKEQKGNRKRG